jgi:sRNA-binding protein
MSKKAPAQWLLRFQSPSQIGKSENKKSSSIQEERAASYPIIAKFTDSLDWNRLTSSSSGAASNLFVYYEDEELKEDENDAELLIRDAEYYKRKRAARMKRYYRKKTLLVFECPPEKIYFEGKENNLEISELDYQKEKEKRESSAASSSSSSSSSSSAKGNQSKNNKEEKKTSSSESSNPDVFRYVLFKFVKSVNEGGEETPEIQVIPVSSMYTLRKTGKFKDELLSEVEEKYIDQKKALVKQMSKYKTIVSSLTAKERAEAGNNNDSKVELIDEISETDVFKHALNKAFGYRIPKKAGGGRTGMGGGGGGGGGGSSGRGERGDMENEEEEIGRLANGTIQINETGIDMDELKEFSFCGGDYETRFADDEEDNVASEQLANQQTEDNELSQAWRNDENLTESDDDSDDEDDDGDGGEGGVGGGGDGSGGGTGGNESGFVDQSMLDVAQQAQKQLKMMLQSEQRQQQKQQQQRLLQAQERKQNVSSSSSSSSTDQPPIKLKSALKRSRDVMTGNNDEEGEVDAGENEGKNREEGMMRVDEYEGMTNDNEGLIDLNAIPKKSSLKRNSDSIASDLPNMKQEEEGTTGTTGKEGNQDVGVKPEKKKAKISFAEASSVSSISVPVSSSSATASTNSSGKAPKDYDLSEAGIKTYILNRGGKVAIKEISEV